MLKSCTLAAAIAVGLGVLWSAASPARASAQATDVYLRASGITLIGVSGDRTVAGTLSLNGCRWLDVGPAKLDQDYVLHGSVDDDTIRLVDLPNVPWCNRTLSALNQQGHAFQIHGGPGNDTIYGSGATPFPGNPNWVFGDEGNDTLYLAPGGSKGDGGPGNDTIYGTGDAGDILIGGDGDDVLCQRLDVTTRTLDGGDGFDVSCSQTVTDGKPISIELFSCLPCATP